MSYAERYCKALEAFADPLTPADRTPAEEISKAESWLGISLPEALRGGSGNLDAKDKWIFCLKAA
jgi:hypothetical protein